MWPRSLCYLPFLALLISVVSAGADLNIDELIDEVAGLESTNRKAVYLVTVLASEPSADRRQAILSWASKHPDLWLMRALVEQIQPRLLPPQENQSDDEKYRLVKALGSLAVVPSYLRRIRFDAEGVLARVALEHRGIIATEAMLTWGLALRHSPFSEFFATPALDWASKILLAEPSVPGESFSEEALLGLVELIDRAKKAEDGARWMALAKQVVEQRGGEGLVGNAALQILRRSGDCGPGMARLGNAAK